MVKMMMEVVAKKEKVKKKESDFLIFRFIIKYSLIKRIFHNFGVLGFWGFGVLGLGFRV